MNRCKNLGIDHKKPAFSPAELLQLRKEVDAVLDKQIEKFNATVPYATHFQNADQVNQEYYARHLIETVYRIRMLRVSESKALAEIAKVSPEAAKIWANYEMEEMVHDEMFLMDLKRVLGVSKEEAFARLNETEPYLSTKLLTGYFSYLLDHEGPLGVIAYSYLVEYVNVKLDPKKIDGLKKSLGSEKIKGQVAHTFTDHDDDHPGEVWEALTYLLQDKNDIDALYRYLDEHQRILIMFFNEIYEDVILKQKAAAA